MSDNVASDISKLDVVDNVGLAVGIASIALSVSKLQSTSGLGSAMLIKGSQPCPAMSTVTSAAQPWWKMWGYLLKFS